MKDDTFSLVEHIIDLADFDEYDRDMGTSGLCATFAMALKAAFPSLRYELLCHADENGNPRMAKDGDPVWRHAVVRDDEGRIFDVDGKVAMDDIIVNYCWDNPKHTGGVLLAVDDVEFRRIIMADRKSFDDRYFAKWSQMIADAKEIFDATSAVSKTPADVLADVERQGFQPA